MKFPNFNFKKKKTDIINNIDKINENNKLIAEIEELEELDIKLKKKKELVATYSKRIETLFNAEKKLFGTRAKLAPIREPILFLERTDGKIEMYDNIKGTEFNVPELPSGVEKKIYLGPQWQEEIPYAGKTFKAYRCHEDYGFPHKWGRPNLYTGQYTQLLSKALQEAREVKNGEIKGIPIILETANVNSEALRDRERKILIAWEKFKANAKAAEWSAWAKIILWTLLGIAAIIVAWRFIGNNAAKEVGTIVVQNATSGGIIVG